jgi:putrescine transport system substrate-binding protein
VKAIHWMLVCSLLAPAKHALAQERVVHVYNWSDYISEQAIEGFTKATGIRVVYDVYDSNETLEAKLLAGKSGYDVVFSAARPYAARQVQAKLLQPLNKALLPNWQHADKTLLAGLKDVDPNNQHAVPYMWGTTGIGYNVDKVRAALGANVALDSWQLLLNPSNAKKLQNCGISMLDDEAEGLGAVLVALGRPPQSAVKADLDAAAAAIRAIKPQLRYFHSSRYISDLASGETCVAMGYSGDVLQAKARAEEANNGVQVRYVIPKEGAVRWMDLMVIPKDAPNVAEAHAFINYLLTPAVIAQISDEVGYANGNASALALLSPELRNDPGVYPPPAVAAKLVDQTQISAADKRTRVRLWAKLKTGRP